MTDGECLREAVAISLFAHFALLNIPDPPQPTPPGVGATVQMEMDSPSVLVSSEQGTDVLAAPAADRQRDDAVASRRRRAFLDYLDAIDDAVHARRLENGETGLIGVVSYAFTIRPDGTFTEPELHASSGDSRLDRAARRAILAASGKVRRPKLIGTAPIPIVLHVKYQYDLK